MPVTLPAARLATPLSRRTFLRAAAGAAVLTGLGVPRAALAGGGVDVRAAGAVGDGRTDDTGAFRRALGAGDALVRVPAGTYRLSGELIVPWTVRELVLDEGAVLQQTDPRRVLIRRSGAVGSPVPAAPAGERDVAVTVPGHGRRVGEWVYVCSDDWYVPRRYKPGSLRRVVEVAGDRLTLDRPLVRAMTSGVRLYPVQLAPGLLVHGGGAVEQAEPAASRVGVVRGDFAEDLTLGEVELRRCGGPAAVFWATVGGSSDAWVHDCVDDEATGHFGYGVEARAGTRGLRVAGRIERVRHAFTTNGGWTPLVRGLLNTGEPEDIVVSAVVRDTTSAGLDTHEPGWDITFVPDVAGGGRREYGGMNIRARGVRVHGGQVRDSGTVGIAIRDTAAGTLVESTVVDGVRSGRGITCASPSTLTGVSIRGFGGNAGVAVAVAVPVQASGLRIDGGGVPGANGLELRGSGGSYRGSVRGCAVGVVEYAEASGNLLALDLAGNTRGTASRRG